MVIVPMLLASTVSSGPPMPSPVSVNISQYVGRWYQIYGSASVQWTMEVGGRCVTADYAAFPLRADVVTVTNTVQPPVVGAIAVSGYAVASPLPVPCAPPCAQPGLLDVVLGPPGRGADPSTAGAFNRTNYSYLESVQSSTRSTTMLWSRTPAAGPCTF